MTEWLSVCIANHPECRNLICSPALRARMPKFLSFQTSPSNLFPSTSVFSLFIFLRGRRSPFSISTHLLSRNHLLLIFLRSWFSNDLPSALFSLSTMSSFWHINWIKCFKYLKLPSPFASEFSFLPLHLHLLLLATLKLCSGHTEISDPLSWFTPLSCFYVLFFPILLVYPLILNSFYASKSQLKHSLLWEAF